MTLKKVTHRTRESACDETSILICMYMSRAGLVTKLTPLNGQNFGGVGGWGGGKGFEQLGSNHLFPNYQLSFMNLTTQKLLLNFISILDIL